VLHDTAKQQAARNIFIEVDGGVAAMSLNLLGIQSNEAQFPLTAAGYAYGGANSPTFHPAHSVESQYSFPLSTPMDSVVVQAIKNIYSSTQKQRPNLSRFSDVSGLKGSAYAKDAAAAAAKGGSLSSIKPSPFGAPPRPDAPTIPKSASSGNITRVDEGGEGGSGGGADGGSRSGPLPHITIVNSAFGGGPAPNSPSRSRTQSMAHRNPSNLALASRPDRPLARLAGVGVYYSDSPVGIPPVMMHFLRNIDALHGVVILLTVRFLPMPTVKNVERLLVRAVPGVNNFYQVVARYGYQDAVDHRNVFVSQMISTIMHKLELKAGLKYQGLEDDFIAELEGQDPAEDNSLSRGGVPMFGLEPVHEDLLEEELARQSICDEVIGTSLLVSKFSRDCLDRIKIAASVHDAPQSALDSYKAAMNLIESANEQVVYYLGRAFSRSASGRSFVHNLTVGGMYRTLEMLSFNDSEAYNIPLEDMVELGMALEI